MMVERLRVVFFPSAQRDLDEITVYLARERPSTARRFLRQVEFTCEQLARFPDIAPRVIYTDGPLMEIRRLLVVGFRSHARYYRRHVAGIQVVRILHRTRQWEERLLQDPWNGGGVS